MGVGRAKGKDKAETAANAAVSSPLLETSIAGAKGVIISITASDDVDLEDVENAAEIITGKAHEDANITWGIAFDSELDDEMVITVIATGFDSKTQQAEKPAVAANPFMAAVKPAAAPATAAPAASAASAAPVVPVEAVEPATVAAEEDAATAAPSAPAAPAAPEAPAAPAAPAAQVQPDLNDFDQIMSLFRSR
jgi:cell division protein FtsZ